MTNAINEAYVINMDNNILDYLNGVEPCSEQDLEMLAEQWAEAANSWISCGGNPTDAHSAADQYMAGF